MVNNLPRPRKTLKKLKNYLSKERIVIILGSRQVGKTTLMKMLQSEIPIPSHLFSLESPEELEVFNEGCRGLLAKGLLKRDTEFCLMIDEFHYLQEPNRLFKEIYDTYPKVRILASGSASLEIQQKLKESLAGRKLTLFVYPLDFHEYLQFLQPDAAVFFEAMDPEGHAAHSKKIQGKLLEEDFLSFALYGGLPQVVLEEDLELKKLRLQEIFSTYIQKDIKGILKNIEIAPFNQLIQLVASQTGNLLNIAELSNTLNLKRHQVVYYLEVLQETFVNFLLKPYTTNKRKEVSKTPKTFFYDNGIRNQILKHFAPIPLRSDGGALLENAIFMELKKNLPVSQDLSYWRTKNKTEVDFVLRVNERLFPIEVKAGKETAIPPNLRSFAEGEGVDTAFVLNRTEWSVKKEGGVTYFLIPHFLAGKIPKWVE